MSVEKSRKSSKMSDFVAFRVLSLVLAVGVFSALTACTRPDGEDGRLISAAASKIVFDGERLGLTYRWTKEAALHTGLTELPVEVQHWSADGGRLLIYGIQDVSGAWVADKLLPVRRTLVNMRAADEEFLTGEEFLADDVVWGARGDLYTKLDHGKYLRFSQGDEFCFAASIVYKNTTSFDRSDHFLLLVFCQNQSIPYKLLMNIGLRVSFKGSKAALEMDERPPSRRTARITPRTR